MSKHRKTPGDFDRALEKGKAKEAKKTKSAGKGEGKTIAAEMAETVRREEPSRGAPQVEPAVSKASVKTAAAKPHGTRPASPLQAGSPAQKAQPQPPSPASQRAAKPLVAAPGDHIVCKTVDTIEQSLKAAGRGTVAVNCKLLDFARNNVNSGLDYVKDVAAAQNPVGLLRLQFGYWRDCIETFLHQAQELRTLSAEIVANTNEPLRRNFFGAPPRAA